MRTWVRFAAMGLVLLLPALAQPTQSLSALERLQPGRWEIRRFAGNSLGSICLGDPALLAQIQHRGVPCDRELSSSNGRTATIQYSCRGLGAGRTIIRVETPRLAQIDSQGLDSGAPFAIRAEARRIGPC